MNISKFDNEIIKLHCEGPSLNVMFIIIIIYETVTVTSLLIECKMEQKVIMSDAVSYIQKVHIWIDCELG